MRILRIDLPAWLKSNNSQINLKSEAVREQLRRDLESLRGELSETIRERASAYFPPDYTIFVRIAFDAKTGIARATVWVDDPKVRWPAALFARRAWALSIPILSHIIKETFEERVQSISLDINEKKARIDSFTPLRGWSDPIILSTMILLFSGVFWYFVQKFFDFDMRYIFGI
ncbi:MAG: hypothetical protein ACR2OX_11380 [Methyloligellaceae bacterium]